MAICDCLPVLAATGLLRAPSLSLALLHPRFFVPGVYACGLHLVQALQHLEYPERLQKLLLTPEREVSVELAILKDNGEVEVGLGLLCTRLLAGA